jgi:hypothetical protein
MKYWVICWLLFCTLAAAQTPTQLRFPTNLQLSDTSKTFVANFLQTQYPSSKYGAWTLVAWTQSLVARHWLWQQTFQEIGVYQQFVKVNVAHDGRILSLASNCFPLINNVADFPHDIPENLRKYIAEKQIQDATLEHSITKTWYIDSLSRQLLAGYLLRYGSLSSTVQAAEILFSSDGKILDYQSLHWNLHETNTAPPDSLVTLAVFKPDPLTSAQMPYGTPYKDENDADCLPLNNERVNVMERVHFSNDTFSLESPFCKIAEFDAPTKPLCFSLSPSFVFTRNNDYFEQINAFYNIVQYQKHLQNLGFNNLANRQIRVDVNALNGSDQSMYSAFSDALYFGEGGVDDAEDADIIWHEYTHAVSRDVAPSTNTGMERQTLEEANCDFMAAAYSAEQSSYNSGRVFNWDGNNEFWEGRSVSSSKLYSERTGHKYGDADIWSSTLMQIMDLIGRNATERNLLQSMYSYASGMRMPDAAMLFLQANKLLRSGADSTAIRQLFVERQILPQITSIQNKPLTDVFFLKNTQAFATGESVAMLHAATCSEVKVNLLAIDGRVLWQTKWYATPESPLSIQPHFLPAGLYFLQVQNSKEIQTFRLVKH